MAASGTFRAQTRRRARELYDAGYGCNAIARELRVGVATISRWAKAEGLSFGREQTELAVRAHTIDLRADLLLATQEALVVARDLVHRVHAGNFTVHAFGGMDGEMHTGVLDEAPPEAVQKALTSLGIAVDKALKVTTAFDEGTDLPAVDQWLEHMTTGVA